MSQASARRRALALPLCVAVPLGAVIAANALARPALAATLDGTRTTTFTNYRSFDGAWTFSEDVQQTHPALTRFLEFTDGAIAAAGITLAVGACLALLLSDRLRDRRRTMQ